MTDDSLEKKYEQAVWVAHSLFERGKTAGSSANLSFLHEDKLYITGSGTCFGTLKKEDFSVVDLSEKRYNEIKPSKELPLHRIFYE
ncbi:MAG: class II aldolase/adducin family protein, partial [Lachnospiraceae bacterium]|nr:class II aldolase/adducin family protein [Lachnospiraceae bacterium]